MQSYSDLKQEKINRYKELANKKEEEANALYNKATKMAEIIPMGQPIMIGHHSEKSDRAYRKRIDRTYSKSIEVHKKAEYYREKAEAMKNNKAISSDDPEAIDKLEEKLAELIAKHETMKQANKIIKKKGLPDSEKITQLTSIGFSEKMASLLLEPDIRGFKQYEIANSNANIKRIKDRIETLKKESVIDAEDREYDGFIVSENKYINRIQFIFDSKPSEQIRSILKQHGFRWSPSNYAWQRQLNNIGRYKANEIVSLLAK